MLSRKEAIKKIFVRHKNGIFITNTGYISRAVYNQYPSYENIFYMQGSMGLAPSIGLGIALNSNKEVVVISGDGSLLMHLGITHTISEYNLKNLFVYVLDNECHESVGGYSCSKLNKQYKGVTEVIKITNDGKTGRVELDCETNTKNVKEFING